jgi:hypothetical protein
MLNAIAVGVPLMVAVAGSNVSPFGSIPINDAAGAGLPLKVKV